jgi:hypothetical protein
VEEKLKQIKQLVATFMGHEDNLNPTNFQKVSHILLQECCGFRKIPMDTS